MAATIVARSERSSVEGLYSVLWVVLVVGVVALSLRAAKGMHGRQLARRKGLEDLARRLGFRYEYNDPFDLPSRFDQLEPLARGENRTAFHVVFGRRGDAAILAFDGHYHEYFHGDEGAAGVHDRVVTHAMASLPIDLPRLRVRPRGRWDAVRAHLGVDSSSTGNPRFDRQFQVRVESGGPPRATLLGPLLDFLADRPGLRVDFGGGVVLVSRGTGPLPAEGFEELLDALFGILERLPLAATAAVAPPTRT